MMILGKSRLQAMSTQMESIGIRVPFYFRSKRSFDKKTWKSQLFPLLSKLSQMSSSVFDIACAKPKPFNGLRKSCDPVWIWKTWGTALADWAKSVEKADLGKESTVLSR